jgi:hypothetical protein
LLQLRDQLVALRERRLLLGFELGDVGSRGFGDAGDLGLLLLYRLVQPSLQFVPFRRGCLGRMPVQSVLPTGCLL